MTRISNSDWYWGGDRAQNRAINELDAAIDHQRRSHQRGLQQTRRELTSGLERVDSRLSSVSERIDALIEWTERRFQLLEFDEYAARRAVRAAFRSLAGGVPAPVPDLDDVPGYWLPPAAVPLLRLIVRDTAPSRGITAFADLNASLELARERDAVRTELFSLAAGRCFDQPAFVDAAAMRLLAEPAGLGVAPAGAVAGAWRLLWEDAAADRFDPAARAQLADRLGVLFDEAAIDDDELKAWDAAVLTFAENADGPAGRTAAFDGLRDHLAADGPTADEPHADEPWRTVLRELIEEPSPSEEPFTTALDQLQAAVGDRPEPPAWSAPVGTVPELIRADLFGRDVPAARRRIALRVAAPLLRVRVERLADTEGPAATRTIRFSGIRVEVDRDGADREQFANAERRLRSFAAVESPSTVFATIVGVALGLAAVLSAATGAWFLALLFACGVAVPVWRYRSAAAESERAEQRVDEDIAALRVRIAEAKQEIRDAERERAAVAAAMAAARDRLVADLTTEGAEAIANRD